MGEFLNTVLVVGASVIASMLAILGVSIIGWAVLRSAGVDPTPDDAAPPPEESQT